MKRQGSKGCESEELYDSRGTYQTITVVNSNRGPRDICDITNEGAVSLKQLPVQYSLCLVASLSVVGQIIVSNVASVPKALNLIMPLHHGPRCHQVVIRAQAQVKFLPKGSDVEEKSLVRFISKKYLPLDTLLVTGREQV